MKINENFIKNIFNYKIKLKNNADKKKLSLYFDIIPMYDIYTQKIYPIKKEDIYVYLTESHYRFINNEVKNWIIQNYEKYSKKLTILKGEEKEKMSKSIERLKKMIQIIDNYDIDVLIDTSYKVLYKYSSIGLTISICKRESFNPFINYLKPYYTKTELVKLGQNMGLIKNIKPEDLIDEVKHYEICKNISHNDFSFDIIKDNTINIIKNKSQSDICFYSFIGSTLLNRFLRNQDIYTINSFFYNRLCNIINTIKTSPMLDKEYQLYRFISDDSFLQNLKIGDTFSDPGFVSTTRDPFYSPGLNGIFGLILLKINLKKNTKGSGLLIEHLSLFPKEEEYLLPPNTKLKLISKDNNFKYYHTKSNFEKLINKKYEFNLIDNNYDWFMDIKPIDEEIPEFENLYSSSPYLLPRYRLELLQNFKDMTNKDNQIYFNGMLFTLLFFDSTSSYSKFYHNKVQKGLSLIHFDERGYPLIFIEMGHELVVNFITQYYFYDTKDDINEKNLIILLTKLGKIFNYKKALIYHSYSNYIEFKNNYYTTEEPFLYINHFNKTLYKYLKNDKKPFEFEPFYNSCLKDIEIIINKYSIKKKVLDAIETDFNEYNNLINLYEINKLNYGIFNIYEKLISLGEIDTMLDLDYDDEYKKDDILQLIYRQPIRRGVD
jgi:hypothetical protein